MAVGMMASRKEKYLNNKMLSTVNADDRIDIIFDINTLNTFLRYLLHDSKYIRRSHLSNMSKLFNKLDLGMYKNDLNKLELIRYIDKALEARLSANLKQKHMIVQYIQGGMMDNTNPEKFDALTELSADEVTWVNNSISEILNYSYLNKNIEEMISLCTKYKSGDFLSKGEIVREIELKVDDIKTNFRKNKTESIHEAMFSLQDGLMEEMVHEVHDALTSPSTRIITGMQGLNEMTYGGFEAGRVYMIFGLPGVGKSVTLLNLAYQIKKYNVNYICKDPSKRPAVLFLTMENTVRETVERIFALSAKNDIDMTSISVNEAIDVIRNDGELVISEESPIDIIVKYVPNGSVDTGYLYTITEDLEDQGIEVIALVQDYIKCIRSANRNSDLRIELGDVVKEFKVFAAIKDIPVITASQLNRDAAKEIDAAKSQGKMDSTKSLTRGNIGESMLMLENADWAAIIGKEFDAQGNRYLGFNRVKIRGKSTPLEYIVQPFSANNGIRFVEDIFCPEPMFKETLKENAGRQNDLNIRMGGSLVPNNPNLLSNPTENKPEQRVPKLSDIFGRSLETPKSIGNEKRVIEPPTGSMEDVVFVKSTGVINPNRPSVCLSSTPIQVMHELEDVVILHRKVS